MSDGVSEWHKMRWEQELKAMSDEEREKALRPRPRPKPKREMKQFDDFTEDGVIYGEPPFWKQALDWASSKAYGSERKMLQIALCSIASFWMGYWVGAQ